MSSSSTVSIRLPTLLRRVSDLAIPSVLSHIIRASRLDGSRLDGAEAL